MAASFFCFFLTACELITSNTVNKTQPPLPPPPQKVTIAAVGDIMMHQPQIKAGKTSSGYDFRKFFTEVKPYLSAADITVANFETTLAGATKGYSGFPRFNAPDEILDAIKDAGIDLITSANNHSNDTGEQGIIRTFKKAKAHGLLITGTSPTSEERQGIIINKNGIKLGFLSYTQHTNGLPVAADKPYLINRIDPKMIATDIQQIKQQGAEYVLVALHWGDEYKREPNQYQKQMAKKVLAAGADVILGSHPHVQQPVEKITINGQEKVIIYSMGNFISNQSFPYTDEGVIVYLQLEKDRESGKIQLVHTSFLPTLVNKYKKSGKTDYTVVPITAKTPTNINNYTGLTERKWIKTWDHVTSIMTKITNISVFSPT
jgi:poly-gamma-glutamate capsule biosynthesis protein CapA/YwtB (metallophosphatase superfamily)